MTFALKFVLIEMFGLDELWINIGLTLASRIGGRLGGRPISALLFLLNVGRGLGILQAFLRTDVF